MRNIPLFLVTGILLYSLYYINSSAVELATESDASVKLEEEQEGKKKQEELPVLEKKNIEPVQPKRKKVSLRKGPTLVSCKGKTIDLLSPIRQYADSVSALKLSYNSATRDDCSGTFIKLNQYLNTWCSDLDLPSFARKVKLKNGKKIALRSSRDLIQYYYDKGSLKLINDPLADSHLIQPGMVLFYTVRGTGGTAKIRPDNLSELVNHVGIVTEVNTDEEGVVQSYKLFHGRNPGSGINITDYHRRVPFTNKQYPYGNGQQQWMAITRLVELN